MLTFLHYVAYFFLYSALGWFIESVYCSVKPTRENKKLTFINRGFCTGPVCPIYGTSAIVMALTLSFFYDKIWLLALMGIVVCDAVEYLTSFIMEKLFNARWWDYTGYFMNINGRICLRNSLIWGILAVVFIRFIHPFVISMVNRVPLNIFYILLGVVVAVFLVDLTNTVVASLDIRKIQKKFRSLKDAFALPENNMRTEEIHNNILLRLNEVKDNMEKLSPHRRSKAKRIFREYPSILNRFHDQVSELQSVPSEFADQLSEIKDGIKDHFTSSDDDIMF